MKRMTYGLYALISYTIGMASLLYLCGFFLAASTAADKADPHRTRHLCFCCQREISS